MIWLIFYSETFAIRILLICLFMLWIIVGSMNIIVSIFHFLMLYASFWFQRGGGTIDLEPCLVHSSTVEPTLAPVAVERTMTTRAAASVLLAFHFNLKFYSRIVALPLAAHMEHGFFLVLIFCNLCKNKLTLFNSSECTAATKICTRSYNTVQPLQWTLVFFRSSTCFDVLMVWDFHLICC